MTIKTATSFTDERHELVQDEADCDVALDAMKDEIRARMATPREEFVPVEGDNLFERVRALLKG